MRKMFAESAIYTVYIRAFGAMRTRWEWECVEVLDSAGKLCDSHRKKAPPDAGPSEGRKCSWNSHEQRYVSIAMRTCQVCESHRKVVGQNMAAKTHFSFVTLLPLTSSLRDEARRNYSKAICCCLYISVRSRLSSPSGSTCARSAHHLAVWLVRYHKKKRLSSLKYTLKFQQCCTAT